MARSDPLAAVYRRTADYYGAKVREHGATPLGADWRCEPTQQLRFVQLLRLCELAHPYSLNDLGCGYGALLHFLGRRRMLRRVDYLGVDVSPDMIANARRARPRHASRFVVGTGCPRLADYSVASGIFNVRLDLSLAVWESFVRQTLDELCAVSRCGFAVNFMEPLPAGLESPPELYRPGIQTWVNYLERELGLRVEPLGGYGLREITLLARRA